MSRGLSFNVIVKRRKAAHAWVVSGATEISIYYYHNYHYYKVDPKRRNITGPVDKNGP